MKDTIFEDYVFIKERIEFHCDKIIELLRLHSDLIFKTKKGDKWKQDIKNNNYDIKNLLIRNMDNFHLKDDKYENFKNLSKAYVFIHNLEKDPNDLPEDDEKVIIIYSIEKDHFEQKLVTYNKSNNRFYVDEFQYIDTNAKFIAWYKTINYKKD